MIEDDKRKIRLIIKNDYNNYQYSQDKLTDVVNEIYNKFITTYHNNVHFDEFLVFINCYIHYLKSSNSYKFNIKSKNITDNHFPNIDAPQDNTQNSEQDIVQDDAQFDASDNSSNNTQNDVCHDAQNNVPNNVQNYGQDNEQDNVQNDVQDSADKQSNIIDHNNLLKNNETSKQDSNVFDDRIVYKNNIENDATATLPDISKLHINKHNFMKKKVVTFKPPYNNDVNILTYKHSGSYNYPFEIHNPVSENNQYNTDCVYDPQYDDFIDNVALQRSQKCDLLKNSPQSEQRTSEWYEMRKKRLTASDLGTILGINKYEQQYKIILKKTVGIQFEPNEACYHGKKFEKIAILFYENKMNCLIDEYGLIVHNNYPWLGASPDGICGKFKYDGIHISNKVGKMLEIKCPLRREIICTGEIYDNICPSYYWAQVQLQLECCDLDECDFMQCKISEYYNRESFLNDTNPDEPHKSLSCGFEKGYLIQLLPIDKITNIRDNYYNIVYDHAIFIYPPKIDMSPFELDVWFCEAMSNIKKTNPYCVFDKIVYWKLEKYHIATITREKKWFEHNFKTIEYIWNLTKYFQDNSDDLKLFTNYIDNLPKKMNKQIMAVADSLSKRETDKSIYLETVNKIKKDIDTCKKLMDVN